MCKPLPSGHRRDVEETASQMRENFFHVGDKMGDVDGAREILSLEPLPVPIDQCDDVGLSALAWAATVPIWPASVLARPEHNVSQGRRYQPCGAAIL